MKPSPSPLCRGLLCVLLAAAALAAGLLLFYTRDGQKASRMLKEKTGLSLPVGAELIRYEDTRGFFGEGEVLCVWQLDSMPPEARNWKALPLPETYREELIRLSGFSQELELAAKAGFWRIETGGLPWNEGEAFSGHSLTFCMAEESGQLLLLQLEQSG